MAHPKMYRELMHKYWRWGVNMGRTTLETPFEDYFGFTAMDVEEIYHRMVGEGQGTSFRLYDGRIIDWQGEPSNPDRSLYDVPLH